MALANGERERERGLGNLGSLELELFFKLAE